MTHEPITILAIAKNLAYIPFILVGLSSQSYVILAVLMVVDTIFGIMRVYVIHGGEHIKSYRLTSGIISKLTIIGVPLMIAWAGIGVGVDLTILAQWAISMLILSHLYSILGNVYSISSRKDINEFDAVTFVLRRIQLIIEKIIKTEIKTGRTQVHRGVSYKKKKK